MEAFVWTWDELELESSEKVERNCFNSSKLEEVTSEELNKSCLQLTNSKKEINEIAANQTTTTLPELSKKSLTQGQKQQQHQQCDKFNQSKQRLNHPLSWKSIYQDYTKSTCALQSNDSMKIYGAVPEGTVKVSIVLTSCFL